MRCNHNCKEPYKPDPMPEKEEYKYYPHHKHQTETILKCGTSMGSVPLCCYEDYKFQPIVLGTVALDTSNLIKPTVKIDFSSLISFKTSNDEEYFLRLVIRLSKVCEGHPIPLGTWTFEKKVEHEDDGENSSNDDAFVQETDAFCFSWCECDDCPDCCRYIVEIVDQQCDDIDFAIVSNISLTAMVVGMQKSHSY